MSRIRRLLHLQLDTQAWPRQGLSQANKAIVTLVLFSIAVVIIETEKSVSEPYAVAFAVTNYTIVAIFSIEYLARLWAMGERPEYSGFVGRLRFIITPSAIVDLIAILPFFIGAVGNDAFLLRAVRLVRIISLAKLGRHTTAFNKLLLAFSQRRRELAITAGFAAVVLLVSATLMYLVEGSAQPKAFGSIPRALWWSVATLTTVGYGDVYPITALGKILAGVTALAAIGLIAMPTGILAAAFSDAFHTKESKETDDE